MKELSPLQHEDVDMDTFGDDNAHCFAPPAHIAARFYRKSSSRRKTSAHSSRRSSLSSLHSRQSTLSCHGGPQSTHIAQHLRRASIIESRKARLADRAAHAEQVRLRAALAKAQPRAPYSEERALAAQAAREKLLAEITARCEEEVRRAKKIAEETREKKAADHARLKQEMAEKFAETARRRSIYQHNARRPRTTSLAAVEEKKISPAVLRRLGEKAAAKVIQRTWRSHQKRNAIANFLALQLSTAEAQNLSFEDLTNLISEDRVLSATGALLRRLGMFANSEDDLSEKGGVRVFLSSYLIVVHPVQALSHGGQEPQEQGLMQKGKTLQEGFEKFLETHSGDKRYGGKSSQSAEQLLFLFNEYASAFHAWRSQDLTVIVDVMVNSFVNLDLILQATKHDRDGHVAEDYFNAIRQEQIKLLARLKKLAGPEVALSRVRTAVRKARKQRALDKRQPSDEHVPRTSSAGVATSRSISTDSMQVPTPPASPEPHRANPVPSSFESQLGQTMTALPSNREIAHEMQINGTFEVQQQPWTELRNQFLTSLRSSMRNSIESGAKDNMANWTHAMAILIREKLLNLVSNRHPLYDRIDGFLDTKLIDQQCRNGMFSYNDFFETMAGFISQTCSPGRDQLVKDFAADRTSDTIDRLFALINIIDLMTLDHINFQFRMAAQQVIEHGHDYEQACFDRDLQDRTITLSNTRDWWTTARAALPVSPQITGHTIYARALTDLVLSNAPSFPSPHPETLSLDTVRLLHLRATAFHLSATSAILLTTKIRLRRNREALWTKDAERLLALDLLSSPVETLIARIVSIIESSHNMPETTRDGLTDFVKRAIPPAIAAARNAKIAEEEHQASIQSGSQPMDSLLLTSLTSSPSGDQFTEQITTYHLKSLREHIFTRLAASNTAEKVRATTSTPDVLARAGMPEFVSQVGSIVDVLERVRAVDLRAHGRWLDEIADEAEAEQR